MGKGKGLFARVLSIVLAVSLIASALTGLVASAEPVSEFVYLSDLNWISANTGIGWEVQKDRNINATEIIVAGLTYNKGFGTHTGPDPVAGADIVYNIAGLGYDYFEAMVGIQDQGSINQVKFSVLVDGVEKATYIANAQEGAKRIQADIRGSSTLTLRVNSVLEAGNPYGVAHAYDASNWCNPVLFKDNGYASNMLWSNETKTVGVWSNRNLNLWNSVLSINGTGYDYSIGTHSNSDIEIDITGKSYKSFTAKVGSADNPYEYDGGLISFAAIVLDSNKNEIRRTTVNEQHKTNPSTLNLDVSGGSFVILRTLDGGDGIGGDGGAWVEAKFSTEAIKDFEYLSDLNWETASSGIGADYPVQKDRNINATEIIVAGLTYNKGFGTHTGPDPVAGADIVYNIAGLGYDYFEAMVGIQDQGSINQVKFSVLVDGVEKATYIANAQEGAKRLQADIRGGSTLILRVNSIWEVGDPYGVAHACDASNWCNPVLFKANDYASNMIWSNETKTVGVWSNRNFNLWNAAVTINETSYTHTFGTHSNSSIEVDIRGKNYNLFTATVGSADNPYSYVGGLIGFTAIVLDADKIEIRRTTVSEQHKTNASSLNLDVTGGSYVSLLTTDGGDGIGGDGGAWAEAKFSNLYTGIIPNSTYYFVNGNKVINLNGSTATLNGSPFASGSSISATGDYTLVVSDSNNNLLIVSFTYVKYGDINGDGIIGVDDLAQIKSHLLKAYTLSGANKKAADISNNGSVSISDLMAVKKQLLGMINLNT